MVLGLGLASVGGTARADSIIYNSLDKTYASFGGISSSGPLADSFSTGSTASSLTDVQFYFGLMGSGSGTVTVSLLSDSSTTPGTSLDTLGTINVANLSNGFSVVDVSSFMPYALAANTRYWIELSTADSSNLLWIATYSSSGTGVANENYYFGGSVFGNGNGTLEMQVSVSPATVPEPSSLILLGIAGLVGLVVWLSRRSLARRGALPAAA